MVRPPRSMQVSMKGGMKAMDWAFSRGASKERKKRSWSCVKVRVAVERRSGAEAEEHTPGGDGHAE